MRTQFKKVLRRVCRGEQDDSVIAQRARLAARINEVAEHGFVVVHVWQMDCDCASWDSFEQLPANVTVVSDFIDRIYEGAEGRVTINLIKPSEEPSDSDKPRPRDHALEAYENGHPYSVHLGDTA